MTFEQIHRDAGGMQGFVTSKPAWSISGGDFFRTEARVLVSAQN